LLEEAWKDEAWGTLVWLAMTTGARRWELRALATSPRPRGGPAHDQVGHGGLARVHAREGHEDPPEAQGRPG
jgi:hypothetical protein